MGRIAGKDGEADMRTGEPGHRDGWNPYLAGALAGLLAVGSAAATARWSERARFLGASGTFARVATLIQRQAARLHPEHAVSFAQDQRVVDWQFMLVVGILLGAFVGSRSDRSFQAEGTPPVWSGRFGGSWRLRAVGAFLGGCVAMFGARLADGCPIGHGLSGLMQLSLSGFAATAIFFAVGSVAARLIYRGGGR